MRWLGLALACGIIAFAASVHAQRPVILSFERSGLLTWSNAYPDAVASVERWSDVVTTGSVVTVTETLGISDGLSQVYSYTVAHPPIVDPSVTISDGTYSWNDVTGSSSPANFLGTVSSYASGQVSAIYLSAPSPFGTVIQVEYSYLLLSTNQEWVVGHSAPVTSHVMQVTVEMSEDIGLFRVVNSPSPTGMVRIPGGSNSGTNPLAPGEVYWGSYPETYSLSVETFYLGRYEVSNDEMVEVMQWAYDHGLISASPTTVSNLVGNRQELLSLNDSSRITWDGSSFGIKADKGSGHPCMFVSWYGAVAYCNYRSEMEGRGPCYDLSDWSCNFSANGYRLPTSEEWEYAGRGGAVSRRFPWGGDTISHSQANYYATDDFIYDLSSGGVHPLYGGTSPVGSFAANAYGLYDMAGNMYDWCYDWHPDYVGTHRVFRGGNCWSYADMCRVGLVRRYAPQLCSNIGFRVVLPAGQ